MKKWLKSEVQYTNALVHETPETHVKKKKKKKGKRQTWTFKNKCI